MQNTTTITFVKDSNGDIYRKTVTETYQKTTVEQLLAKKNVITTQISRFNIEDTNIDDEIAQIEALLEE